ncbi:hypothetical protein FOZ61_005743 [Perkinsus olseni]|uniref:TIR domain-containing protein n=1 Tax=Perkinsus olseni TaxID=32597 RepID=A0A7J6LG46_PEROL|nr:hypothetical protein FOZ61_005743 [Perkinsus olseni]
MVFLDKCCISQKDPVAKKYGISKLADYLRVSNKLLILWSPDYLDRFWCVYELAVFLQKHDEKDVVLVNLNHIKLCVSLMLLQLLIILTLCLQLYYKSLQNVYIGYLLGLVTSLLIGREAFTCSKEWHKFCSRVGRFNVREAKCTSSADYYKLEQLITDMYGSETKFAAVVRCLWLGGGKEKRFPTWLFSGASLRIMCAPYIPLIVACAVDSIISTTIGLTSPMVPTYSQSEAPWGPPSRTLAILWASRLSIFPIMMMCLRAPFMLLVGHELATRWGSQEVGEWRLVVAFAMCFGAYNLLTQLVCGLRMFHHPLSTATLKGFMDEALLWVSGFVALTVVSFLLRRSYAYQLPKDLS